MGVISPKPVRGYFVPWGVIELDEILYKGKRLFSLAADLIQNRLHTFSPIKADVKVMSFLF